MTHELDVRISLSHASERARERLRALLEEGRAPATTVPDPFSLDAACERRPQVADDTLIVPFESAWETWTALSRSTDPGILAVAFRLFRELAPAHEPEADVAPARGASDPL